MRNYNSYLLGVVHLKAFLPDSVTDKVTVGFDIADGHTYWLICTATPLGVV